MLEFYVNVTGEFHFNPFRIKIVYFLFPVIYNRLSILLAIAVGCLLANIGCANASYGGYGSGSYGTGARYGEICLSSDHACKMGWNQNGRIRRRRWDVLPIILNDTAADVSVLLSRMASGDATGPPVEVDAATLVAVFRQCRFCLVPTRSPCKLSGQAPTLLSSNSFRFLFLSSYSFVRLFVPIQNPLFS